MERGSFAAEYDPRPADEGGFVGRGEEARRLRDVLRAGPALAVVRGEAGAGLSRLVDEVLGAAEFAGWTQVRGACPDTPDAAPLGPVVDALAALPHRPGLLRRPLPPVTGTVGLVVPELAGLLPPPPASAADPETRRGLLPRAVGTLLEAFGDAVLVLEDIHRADPATLGLLHRLLRAMPPRLRLVVTEDAAPGLPVLGVRVPGPTRLAEVRVRPWTPEETEEFVRRWPGTPRPERAEERQELAALVHELTGGLPGAAEALLRAAEETGPHTEGEDGPWAGSVLAAVREAGVPARVRREMARRCAPLGEDAWRIVEAAAVLDRAVPVGLLAEVAQVAPGRAEAAVDACVRRSVLRADGPHPVFRHPLDRRAALARVPGPRLARLSLRAARALHRGGAGPLPLADLARLYRAAGRAREGLRCLVAAADRAADGGDYTTATRLYTQAVADDPGAGGRIRTAAKLARTAQLSRAGDQVVAAVRQVLDEDDPPPRLRGEIRLHLSVVLRNQSGGALDSLDEVARAIPDLEASDPQTAARAMAVAAIPSIKGWPVDRHRAWLDRAETLAGRVTDPVARAAIAANRATALMLLGDPRAWAAAEALAGPAGTAMEGAHHARGWTNLAHASSALGYGVRARAFLDRAADGLADTSSPYLEGLTQTARLVLTWHEGGWRNLHAAADRTTRLYQEIPDLRAEAMLVRGLTALHVLGDVPRARRDLAEAARVTCYDTGVILTASAAATARIHLEAGRPGQACEAVEETLRQLERTGGWVWAGEVLPTAVEALRGSGRTARAHRLVADFAAGTADRDAPAARAALTVCRALLAEAEDRPEDAVGLLDEAEARWRRLGRPFDAARAAEARGRCLLGLRGEAAAGGVQEVIEVYRELGARWDVARCQRLLRRHDIVTTHRRGRLGYGDQLSPREQEVARLVVQGRANRDIAESLVLSTRTVEHHVARIMRKLNATSRTDIALVGWDEAGAGTGGR
ncbi:MULTISPECIES: LuxR family transcriptional regulator [unclassified Streptomyces]|nr:MULTISPECIES: LuxR family transcriptional regulator [unclassified Streptomyces]MYR67137.1 AAA family ATPase [Streptomyces sp. SID4939]MYT67693.1 AAA family ATPase [Streptomyces sp. SID8357]MYT86537.1 AAA family ATPase [Streptomyces sp. SID8360]MYW41253.1 AAA family ATPase [Streptomyces sp. SID1]AEN13804.1 transcriptional regulator, LuxR family [Streptomyces sp. SirexAA-E]